MVDNKDLILPLLKFESEDDFYYLQIIQRKKEHPDLNSNSRVVKNYYIHSKEYLEERYDQIKKLCDIFNARACLRLNKRSYRKVAFKALQRHADVICNGEYSFCRKSYDRAIGKSHSDPVKKWIIDIDEPDPHRMLVNNVAELIGGLEPFDVPLKTIALLPSKSGWHLITTPFNVQKFKADEVIQQFGIEIHKDNPTNLYIP